jgi:hypothetical protein
VELIVQPDAHDLEALLPELAPSHTILEMKVQATPRNKAVVPNGRLNGTTEEGECGYKGLCDRSIQSAMAKIVVP